MTVINCFVCFKGLFIYEPKKPILAICVPAKKNPCWVQKKRKNWREWPPYDPWRYMIEHIVHQKTITSTCSNMPQYHQAFSSILHCWELQCRRMHVEHLVGNPPNGDGTVNVFHDSKAHTYIIEALASAIK